MGEANDRGTKEERIAEAKLQSTYTPVVCNCGLDPLDEEAMEKYEGGFLCFPIQNMGIAHFVCPRCFTIKANKECFEVQKLAREKAKNRSKQVMLGADGKTPGGLILPGRGIADS